VRQSNWFYGLHLPTASQLVVEPIASLLNGSLFAPPSTGQASSAPISDNASTILLSSGKVTDVAEALTSSVSPQPSVSSTQNLGQQVSEIFNSAVANHLGPFGTTTDVNQLIQGKHRNEVIAEFFLVFLLAA
jgi:hypothetical protein